MKYKIIIYLILTFSLQLFLYSCKKETIIFQENFNNNSNHWDTVTLNNKLTYNKIENGKLIMSSKVDNVINLSLIQSNFLNKNISLVASITVEKFYDQDGLAGMILFADNQKFPENYLFFGVNNKNEVLISKESKNPELAQIFYQQKNKTYLPDKSNQFSIFTNDNIIQFILNKKPVISINKPKNSGNFYGFIVLDSKIIADDLIVTSNN